MTAPASARGAAGQPTALIEENRRRSRQEFEYELLDTGIFGGHRYFDVFVEYAKASPEDILIQVTMANRGPEPATLHVLPTLRFRNTWSWGGGVPRPMLRQSAPGVIAASHPDLGQRFLACEGASALLFTDNETNTERLFGTPNRTPYVNDAIHACIVHGRREAQRFRRFLEAREELRAFIHDPLKRGQNDRLLGAVLDENKLRRVLATMLDEREFLSPHGIRALSRYHAEYPYVFHVGDQEYRVSYLPAEPDSGMFGGNSNRRGPIWMPVNALIIRAMLQYYVYYGDEFTIECPTGSGRRMTLYPVAEEISHRMASIFLRGDDGRRPVYGGTRKYQTGWTGVVARGMHLFATSSGQEFLELGKAAGALEVDPPPRGRPAARGRRR